MQHEHRLRVRYGETDQMGVVHHASYVLWLEEARIEWLRAHGQCYRSLEASGVFLPVIELQVRYRAPARFDEELTLYTNGQAVSPTRLIMNTRIVRAETLLAEGQVTLAAINRDGRPIRIPAALMDVTKGESL